MTPPRKYFLPNGREVVRFVPCTLWKHTQFLRLLEDIAEAPLIPPAFIDRYARAEAYSPWRAKNSRRTWKDRLLSPMQYKVLLALSQGKNFEEMKLEGISADPKQSASSARARLGSLTNEQAVAVAVANGILPVPEPTWPPGRNFQLSGSMGTVRRQLTKREQQLIVRIANGKTDQDIADEFGTSMQTVHKQVNLLRAKYSAKNRAHLAALAIRMGHIG